MNVLNAAKEGIKSLGVFVNRESPNILTGVGVVGVVTTAVLAVKATPKALYLLEEAQNTKPLDEDLTPLEVVKTTWKCYIPATLVGGMTIAAIIGANRIHTRRTAAIFSLYAIAEEGLREYQEKVIEVIGANKEGKIRDEIAQDRLNKNPVEANQVIVTGRGEALIYDSLSGRYFKSDLESIRKAVNDFNERLISEMYLPLNEFYDSLGLEGTETGKRSGWMVDKGMLEIRYSSKIATNGQPAIVLDYKIHPEKL